MMVLLSRLSLAAVLALSATMTHAAVLTVSDGDVLISNGGAYAKAVGTVDVAPGTSIIVNPGGAAELSYGPDCAMAVPTGGITTVAAATGTGGCPLTEASTNGQITTQAAGVAGVAGGAGGAGAAGAAGAASGAGGAAGAAAGAAGSAAGAAGAAAGVAGATAGAMTLSAPMIAMGAGAVATATVTTQMMSSVNQKPASP